MNTNTSPLRVITLKDGRMVKEVPETDGCEGCMFKGWSGVGCVRYEHENLRCCGTRRTIYQPADPEPQKPEPVKHEPVAYLWRHAGTGRTRLVDPDCVITTQPGGWELVGPLVLGTPEPVKREPLTDEQIERAHGIGQQDKGGRS